MREMGFAAAPAAAPPCGGGEGRNGEERKKGRRRHRRSNGGSPPQANDKEGGAAFSEPPPKPLPATPSPTPTTGGAGAVPSGFRFADIPELTHYLHTQSWLIDHQAAAPQEGGEVWPPAPTPKEHWGLTAWKQARLIPRLMMRLPPTNVEGIPFYWYTGGTRTRFRQPDPACAQAHAKFVESVQYMFVNSPPSGKGSAEEEECWGYGGGRVRIEYPIHEATDAALRGPLRKLQGLEVTGRSQFLPLVGGPGASQLVMQKAGTLRIGGLPQGADYCPGLRRLHLTLDISEKQLVECLGIAQGVTHLYLILPGLSPCWDNHHLGGDAIRAIRGLPRLASLEVRADHVYDYSTQSPGPNSTRTPQDDSFAADIFRGPDRESFPKLRYFGLYHPSSQFTMAILRSLPHQGPGWGLVEVVTTGMNRHLAMGLGKRLRTPRPSGYTPCH